MYKRQLFYREEQDGQILEEGITEAGSMASFTAAGQSYSTYRVPMIPFYMYYSMFGFQRIGDMACLLYTSWFCEPRFLFQTLHR